MTPFRRWSVVAAGTLLLVGAPIALHLLPAADSDVSAGRLLAQARAAEGHAWSGFVETEGTLQLPDADRFSDVGALFGEHTRMRAWWQDDDHWRVDQLLLTGETDLVHEGETTLRWDYEHLEATLSRDPDIRLPRTADLVPPVLAERLLRGVVADDVRRVPARRVAGVSAPGLRVVPSSDLSSIDHADLWLDPDSGVPLRVEVYAAGHGHRRLHQRVPGVLERPSRQCERRLRPAGRRRRGVRRRPRHRRRRQPVRARCARPTPWPGCRRRRPRTGRSASTDAG